MRDRAVFSPSLRLCFALFWLSTVVAACGPAAQPRGASHLDGGAAASRDASGLTTRPAAGRPGAAPARRAPTAAAGLSSAAPSHGAGASRSGASPQIVSEATLRRLAAYADSLKNAARRDRAMELTMRTYMLMTREVFRRLRGSGTSSGPGGSASYDPAPAWRFQAQLESDLRALADRSGVIDFHLRHLATAAAGAGQDAAGRGERIALFRSIFSCIRSDTLVRAEHGKAWNARSAEDGAAGFTQLQRVRLYGQELRMMRTSVRCSRLIASRRGPDD